MVDAVEITEPRPLDAIMGEAVVVIAEKFLGAARAGHINFFEVAKALDALNKHIDEQAAKRQSEAPRERTKLDEQRAAFHGHTPPRRRTRRKAATGEGDAASASAGANGATAAA